jgi:hypothetical protein
VKRSALSMVAALAVWLGGCAHAILPGAGSGSGLTASTVTPGSVSIPGVASQQFTAKTGDGSKPTVNWSVDGIAGGNASLGTIDANGIARPSSIRTMSRNAWPRRTSLSLTRRRFFRSGSRRKAAVPDLFVDYKGEQSAGAEARTAERLANKATFPCGPRVLPSSCAVEVPAPLL